MDLSDRWPLPDAAELRDALLGAYAEPSRSYHDTRHLSEVLDRLDELAEAGARFDPTPVLLAAWFHDGVYDGERDAEERSAVWAEDALHGVAPEPIVAEVARLVRLTESHEPEPQDANGCALSDADLAILASPVERYDEYAAAVRAEYSHLDDDAFHQGRTEVLRRFLDRPQLFTTQYARDRWESAARANLERELEALVAVRS